MVNLHHLRKSQILTVYTGLLPQISPKGQTEADYFMEIKLLIFLLVLPKNHPPTPSSIFWSQSLSPGTSKSATQTSLGAAIGPRGAPQQDLAIVNFRCFQTPPTETSYTTPHYHPKYQVWAIDFLCEEPLNWALCCLIQSSSRLLGVGAALVRKKGL